MSDSNKRSREESSTQSVDAQNDVKKLKRDEPVADSHSNESSQSSQLSHLDTPSEPLLKPDTSSWQTQSDNFVSDASSNTSDNHSQNQNDFQCFYEFCEQHFGAVDDLATHLSEQHDESTFRCRDCSMSFKFHVDRSLHHLVPHNRSRTHFCPRCGSEFIKFKEFADHAHICQFKEHPAWDETLVESVERLEHTQLPPNSKLKLSVSSQASQRWSAEEESGDGPSSAEATTPSADVARRTSRASQSRGAPLTLNAASDDMSTEETEELSPVTTRSRDKSVVVRSASPAPPVAAPVVPRPVVRSSKKAGKKASILTCQFVRCPMYNQLFDSDASYLSHVLVSHNPEQCRHCDRDFQSPPDLHRHCYAGHHGMANRWCWLCAQEWIGASSKTWTGHWQDHVNQCRFSAYHVGQPDREILIEQAINADKPKKVKSVVVSDDEPFVSQVIHASGNDDPDALASEQPLLHCIFHWCPHHVKGFSNEKKCVDHMRAVHNADSERESCYRCSKSFPKRAYNLPQHIAGSHPGWPKYFCHWCGHKSLDWAGDDGIRQHRKDCLLNPDAPVKYVPVPASNKDTDSTSAQSLSVTRRSTSNQPSVQVRAQAIKQLLTPGDDTPDDTSPLHNHIYECFYDWCPSSDHPFETFTQFKQHILLHHPPSVQFHCLSCNQSFDSRTKQTLHWRNEHSMDLSDDDIEHKQFFCQFCGEQFDELMGHHGLRAHSCPFTCKQPVNPSEPVDDTEKLVVAFRKHDTHVCPFTWCQQSFNRATNLVKHVMSVHQVSSTSFVCPYCPSTFSNRSGLTGHARYKHPSHSRLGHWCGYCGIEFATVERLNEHACDYTQYVTPIMQQIDELNNVISNPHSKATPSKAPMHPPSLVTSPVGTTKTRSSISRAQSSGTPDLPIDHSVGALPHDDLSVLHSKPSPFLTCFYRFCQAKFATESETAAHIALVHDQSLFRCYVCPQTFNAKRALNMHISSFHACSPNWCLGCGQVFNWSTNLKEHVARCRFAVSDSELRVSGDWLEKGESPVKNDMSVHGTVSAGDHEDDHKDGSRLRRSNRLSSVTPTDQSSAQCFYEHCKAEFPSELALYQHISVEHPKEQVQCKYCGSARFNKMSRAQHCHASHPGLVFRWCWLCGDEFETQAAESVHICSAEIMLQRPAPVVQTTNPPIKRHVTPSTCFYDFCSTPVASAAALTEHIRVFHNPTQLHRCRWCERSFMIRGALTLHCEADHSMVTPYWCSWCGEEQNSLGHVEQHAKLCKFSIKPE